MQVVSIISTKGGVGKTTTAANLGGFAADAGLRVLLLDLDVQPTLSSYFELRARASGGIYELLVFNEQSTDRLVSHTTIENLDVILSNDDKGQLNTLLLHAPDGRLRLRNLLPIFSAHYDLVLIDTQGARSVLLEMAVLASDLAVSPVTPEILAAREFRRGTLQLMQDIAPYRHLGIEPPPLRLLINRVHPVSTNARLIQQALRDLFRSEACVAILDTNIPALEAYPRASTLALPVHRVEQRRPHGTDDTGRLRHDASPRLRAAAELGISIRPIKGWNAQRGRLMTTAHAFHPGHKRLKPLIDLALKEGWKVVRTPGGHMRFTKLGLPAINTGSTALGRPGHRPADNAKGGLGPDD